VARPSSPHDQALDELYAAAPEEFVLVRARVEGDLRRAGDDAGASDVRARRRPNLAAWACNQLARRDPDGIAALLDATQRIVDAQANAEPGPGAAALRDAARDRHDLLDRLADAAVTVLRGRVPQPDTYRASITATLDAGSLEPERADELRAGRLTRPLAAPAGFGPSSAGPATAGDDATRAETARQALAAARREATATANAAKTAAAELTSATLRADAATAHLHEVERALERARASAQQTAEEARAAQARAEETRTAADAAADALRRAEQIGHR